AVLLSAARELGSFPCAWIRGTPMAEPCLRLSDADPGDDDGNPTIAQLVDWFLEDAAASFSAKHRGTAERTLSLLSASLGGLKAADAKPFDLNRWAKRMHEAHWRSAETMQVRLAIVQRMMNWSVEMELIPRNRWSVVKWEPADEIVRE